MSQKNDILKIQKDSQHDLLVNRDRLKPIITLKNNENDQKDNEFLNFKHFSTSKTENNLKFKIKLKKKSIFPYNTIVMSNVKNSRSFGMSEYHSSNSLRNSIQSWTFKRETKFKDSYKRLLTDSIYNLPDQRNLRSTSIGYGKKYDLMPLEGRGVPGPDNYNIKSHIEINKEKKKGILIYTNTVQNVNLSINIYRKIQLYLQDLEVIIFQEKFL